MKVIFLALIVIIVSSTTTLTVSTTACTCTQILNETECRAKSCQWSDTKCQVYVGSTTTYCSLISVDQCSTTDGCALVSEKCVSFSGCTMYLNSTNDSCQLISSTCTSDGTNCIELDQCKNYKNQTSCYKNENGKYCKWSDSTCSDVENCDDLPALASDSLCRAQLSQCTVAEDGKCVTSAETCELQSIQKACVTDKSGTKVCFWDSTNSACKEKTCANAPTTNTTYDQCKNYLSTCTLNDASAGCQNLPGQCASLTTLNNCVINSSGSTCYWNTNNLKCEDKNCDNATGDYKSDSDCRNWISTCTVKPGGIGCMNRPATCQANTVQIQCYNDSNGGACFWNGSACVDKTCANAPDSNINNDGCQSYLSTCTVQVDLTGCETKKANCTDYTDESQCVSQLDGTLCVYQDSKCVLRICDNAPTDIIADAQCKQFSSTCMLDTVKQAGCITQICNNIALKDQCLVDYQNNTCYYGQVCQLRTCANASLTYKSDEECRNYLSSCTVADSLTGCKIRPTTCAELSEQQCKPLTDGTKCSWNVTTDPSNPVCRNLDCSDITSNNQTNATCTAFDSSCTVAENPSICVAKPSVCDNIVSSDQCFAIVLDDQVSTCSWNSDSQKCQSRACGDASTTITTEADCRAYLSSCTINSSKAGCTDQPNACTGYTSKDSCVKLYKTSIGNEVLCGWNGCEARNCNNAPALTDGVYNDSLCSAYLSSCTVNKDKSGCVTKFTLCSDVADELWCNDTILTDGSHCFWDTVPTTPTCRAFTCTDNTASAMTDATCSAILSSCTLGVNGQGCVNKGTSCSSFTDSVQCEGTILTDSSKCSWDSVSDAANPVCVARTCAFSPNKTKSSDCSTYLSTCTLGASACITKPTQCNGQASDVCNNIVLVDGSTCSWDNTESDTTIACQARTCTDASTDLNTDALCRAWLSTCTVTADESGCVTEPTDCSSMTRSQCVYQSTKKVLCYWNASANPASCRAAQCTDASKTIYTTDTLCATYLSTCTVAATGGCITQPTSCSSLTQTHCPKVTISATGKDASQNQCSWNLTNAVCQDRVCTDAPSTYVTESACRGWLKTCTINVTGQGCITEPATCALLQIQSQCETLSNGTKCGWNTGCVNRTCSNAPDTLTTDAMCRDYLSTCTVQSDGTGCVTQQSSCSGITVQIQCTKANVLCQWNTKTLTCQDRSCANASTTLTTHATCNAYLSTCTVKPTGVGCQSLQTKCSAYSTIGQCSITTGSTKCQWIINYEVGSCVDVYSNCSTYSIEPSCTSASDGTLCIWIEGSCFSRQCSQAPKSYATHELCQAFSSACTTNGKGCIDYQKCGSYAMANSCIKGTDGLCTLVDLCQNVTCNTAPNTYKTDSECATFLKTCTTNGAGCVERKRCQDAYVEAACKTDSSGNQCAWYGSQCVDKTCDTAASTILSEKDCETYYPGGYCTIKKGGGCTMKSKCKNAQIEGACTTQLDGKTCSWQNGTCKLKSCTDLKGYDHKTCNSQQSSCTTDGYMCAAMQTCSNTAVQAACVMGTDGPCLWANGKCYRYTKCTDLTFSTHQECNSIQNQCTSNGINCIAITTCAQTPKVGCFAGIEAGLTIQCIWTPSSTSLSADYSCIKYSACTDAKYLNHSDCYYFSKNQCTTDGSTGCISLDVCTNYTTQESCQVDKNGQIVKSSLITATGLCVWSETCIPQRCQDLIGTSHSSCYNQLSTCTYNGTSCIVQSTCSTYVTSNACVQAKGTDGLCKWNSGACSAMSCSDYPVTLCSMMNSLCIQDGSTCVLQTDCTNYTTQSACDFGSATQVCAWISSSTSTKGKCVAVTSCTIATAYKAACTKLSDRCYWQTITVASVVENICATKTCEIQVDGTCTGFYDWAGKVYTVCQYDSTGKCAATDPTALTLNTCYAQTLYQYTWNPTTLKCSICNAPTTTTNNTTTTNQTNQTIYGSLLFLVPLYAMM